MYQGRITTLIDDYVQPALVYASLYNITEAVMVRTRNNGLLTPTGGENSVNVDRSVCMMLNVKAFLTNNNFTQINCLDT